MTSRPGFTLVEMLIALAIFSLLIAILMLGFQQGMMVWEKANHHKRYWLDMEFTYRLLETAFSQANNADTEVATGRFSPWFRGAPHTLQMITAAPLLDVVGHTRPIEFQLQQSDEGSWQLRYREGNRYGNIDQAINWATSWALLLSSLKSASFSYEAPPFPTPTGVNIALIAPELRIRYHNQAQWVTQFDSAIMTMYPRSVSLHFVDIDGAQHKWSFSLPQESDAWSMGIYQALGS